MKKLLTLALGVTVLLLSACGTETGIATGTPSERLIGVRGELKVVTDIETGCKYIYLKEGLGQYQTMSISPLINKDGTFDCE